MTKPEQGLRPLLWSDGLVVQRGSNGSESNPGLVSFTWAAGSGGNVSGPFPTFGLPVVSLQVVGSGTGPTGVGLNVGPDQSVRPTLSGSGLWTISANGIPAFFTAGLPLATATNYYAVTNGAPWFWVIGTADAAQPYTFFVQPGLPAQSIPPTAAVISGPSPSTLQATVAVTSADLQSGTVDGLVVQAREYLLNGTSWDRRRANFITTLLPSNGYTGTQTTATQTNYNGTGVTVFVNVTVLNSATLTPHIQAVDSVSGSSIDLLVGTAITSIASTTIYAYQVHPALTVASGVSASAILPRNWLFMMVPAAGGLTDTYSVSSVVTAT